jgi:hypothetical protein
LAVIPTLAVLPVKAKLLLDIQGRLDPIPEVRDRVLAAVAE